MSSFFIFDWIMLWFAFTFLQILGRLRQQKHFAQGLGKIVISVNVYREERTPTHCSLHAVSFINNTTFQSFDLHQVHQILPNKGLSTETLCSYKSLLQVKDSVWEFSLLLPMDFTPTYLCMSLSFYFRAHPTWQM